MDLCPVDNLKDWALSLAEQASALTVSERQAGDVVVLGMEGSIIVGTGADALRAVINRQLGWGRNKLLLDMARVRWVDSVGLGQLVVALVSVTRAGGQIKLLRVREKVRKLLAVTKLDTVFAIYDDETNALNDFL